MPVLKVWNGTAFVEAPGSPTTALAGLTDVSLTSPANDDLLQRKSGLWVNRSLAQVKSDLALNNVQNTKHNFAASAVPTTSDDGTQGYSIGSLWLWAAFGLAYICTSATTSLATWRRIDAGVNSVFGTAPIQVNGGPDGSGGSSYTTSIDPATTSTPGSLAATDQTKLNGLGYNYVINAGFEQKQRTASSFTANGAVTLDRWVIALTSSSATVSQITSTIGATGKSMQIAYTHVGGGRVALFQTVGAVAQLLGKAVTFAVTVKCTVAGRVRIAIGDSIATTNSSYNVGTGSERLTVTRTINASATFFQVWVECNVGSCTVEANDATLIPGSTAADYVPLEPGEDLRRCQQYYETGFHHWIWFATTVTVSCFNAYTRVGYRVTKAGAPTVTLSGISQGWQQPGGTAGAFPTPSSAITTNAGVDGFDRELDFCGAWNAAANGVESFTWTSEYNP